MEIPTSLLTYHQRIQQLQQHFWTRWSKEYISELQQRVKWTSYQPSVTSGTMVIIKEDNLPPLMWKLGRIIACHPGKDNNSRMVSIQTATGVVRRAITKVCPLPVDDSAKD